METFQLVWFITVYSMFRDERCRKKLAEEQLFTDCFIDSRQYTLTLLLSQFFSCRTLLLVFTVIFLILCHLLWHWLSFLVIGLYFAPRAVTLEHLCSEILYSSGTCAPRILKNVHFENTRMIVVCKMTHFNMWRTKQKFLGHYIPFWYIHYIPKTQHIYSICSLCI